MKKNIEYMIRRSNISNYKIAKKTGINTMMISNYKTNRTDIGKMNLGNALLIYNLFLEYFEENKLHNGSVLHQGSEYVYVEKIKNEQHYAQVKAIDVDANEYIIKLNLDNHPISVEQIF